MPVFAVKCWDIAQPPVHNIGTFIKKGNTEVREYVPKQPPGLLRDVSEKEYRTEFKHLNSSAKYIAAFYHTAP